MSLNATPALFAVARFMSRPTCPQCGDAQLVPETSEFVGEGRVRHTWCCEDCGCTFETAVEFVTP